MNVIEKLDNSILQFIQINMKNDALDEIMPSITSLGSGLTIWALIGVILLFNRRSRKYGVMIILSLILCFIIGNLTLKPLVARIRPFNARPLLDLLLIKPPTDFSFPSGHAMCSFAAVVVIFYMNKRIGICALILGSLMAFSRLYLYVHYPSDVFFGMVIGILLGTISIIIVNNIEKRSVKIFGK